MVRQVSLTKWNPTIQFGPCLMHLPLCQRCLCYHKIVLKMSTLRTIYGCLFYTQLLRYDTTDSKLVCGLDPNTYVSIWETIGATLWLGSLSNKVYSTVTLLREIRSSSIKLQSWYNRSWIFLTIASNVENILSYDVIMENIQKKNSSQRDLYH